MKKFSANNLIKKSIYRSGLSILLPAFLLVFASFPSISAAQDSLRDSLKSKNSNSKKTNESKSRNSSKPKTTRRTSKKTPPRPKNNLITVTFITNEPNVEIWLNDKKYGETNEEATLQKKLAAGDYSVSARNDSGVIFPATQISVSPEQNTFKLFEEKVPEAETTENVGENKKSEEEIAKETTAQVKLIFENYADPKKTDSISATDWDFVYKSAQSGQLQGSSAVDVEAQRWFASGQIELAAGNFTKAFTAFNKAAEFMPNSGLLNYALGNAHLANKQPAEALKAYQKALQLSPKMGMAYKKLGDANRILDKEKEAIAAYKNAMQFGYDNVETRFALALTLLKTKETEQAIAHLLEVEKEKPAAEVYLALGEAFEKTKRDVSAIENYQKAIQASPASANAYFKLGDVYFAQREYVKAKEAFEKAVELDPEGKVLNKAEAQKKLREAAAKIK